MRSIALDAISSKSHIIRRFCLALGVVAGLNCSHAEELTNGDFEVGTLEASGNTPFVVSGWTRGTTGVYDNGVWLSDGSYYPELGVGNQGIVCRYASFAYQDFIVTEGTAYRFSVDAMRNLKDSRWKPVLSVEWYDVLGDPVDGLVTLDSLQLNQNLINQWYSLIGVDTAPIGAVTGRIRLSVKNTGATPSGYAFFDNASVTLASFEDTEMSAGLAAYWKFDGDLNDASTNALNGIAEGGVTFTTGINGQAVRLDEVSDLIRVSAADIPRPWTVSLWVKKQATGGVETLLDSATNSVRLVQSGSTQIGVSEVGVADGTLDVDCPNGAWTHVAFVANDLTMSVFVNGYAYGAFQNDFAFQSIDLPLDVIGGSGLIGELDEFGVWSRELGAAEIRHLYLGGQGGLSIEEVAYSIDGQPLGLSGPGISQSTYASVGELLAQFDLNSAGNGGEEGRAVVVGSRDGWFYADARNIAGKGGFALYDFSDFTSPQRVSQFYDLERPEHLFHETIDPRLGHYYINHTFSNTHPYWDMTQFPNITEQQGLNITVPKSPDVIAFMVPPYAYYGQYGYPRSHVPMEIWDMSTNTQIASLDFENDLGFRGVPMVLGNLMIITASNGGDGVATYDVSDPANPVQLDVLYGVGSAYEPTIYGDKIVMPGKDAVGNSATSVVDFSDPSHLTLVAQFDAAGSDQYANFQDHFMFVGTAKIDMNTYSKVHNFRHGNQYLMPIGNVVLIVGGQGIAYLMSHQMDPDTAGPYVNYHLPTDGAINQAVTSRIGVTIPETLKTETISPDTFIVRELGGNGIEGTFSYCDKGIINFTPREILAENTTYEVILPAGGIEDIVGNGLANETRFTFTTGVQIIIDPNNAIPSIDSLTLPSSSPLPLNQSVTLTAMASDGDLDPLEYRWRIGATDSGWQSSDTFDVFITEASRQTLTLDVRDGLAGGIDSRIFQLTFGTVPVGPKPVSSRLLAADFTARKLWTVNPDNNTVTEVNIDTSAVLSEIAVGARPSSVAIDGSGRVWVACRDADQLDIIDGGSVTSLALDYGDRPHDLVYSPALDRILVTTEGSGGLIEINPTTQSITRALSLGPSPRAIAVTGDGTRALVTRFITSGDNAEVWDIDLTSFTLTRTITLAKDMEEDSSTAGRGVLNYLGNITISPDHAEAWVSASKVNVDRGEFREGGSGQPNSEAFQNSVRPVLAVIDLSTNQELLSRRFDHDNHSFPSAICFSPVGDYCFIAMRGTNRVIVYDSFNGAMTKRREIVTGTTPDAVLFDAQSGRLFIKNFMNRSLLIHNINGLLELGEPTVNVGTVSTVGSEAMSAEVLLGKQIFYNAGDMRMSLDGYLSCASCHDDGDTDGQTVDFTERGEGLRNTTTLRGKRGTGHGMAHWSGNFDEIQDFEHDIRGPQAGLGFMSNTDFNRGTRDSPIGDAKAGYSADLDALASYVESLDSQPKSPYRNGDGSMSDNALWGQKLFQNLNCAQCHSGADYTDSAKGIRHNIGTIGAGSGTRLTRKLGGIDTPTLRGIWATPPYLHDGSAATLNDVFTPTHALDGTVHARVRTLNSQEQDALIDYLLELDSSNDQAPVNAGVTLPEWKTLDTGLKFKGSSADAPASRGLLLESTGDRFILSNGDDMHFHYRDDINGDFELIARVDSIQAVQSQARVGLMTRESADKASASIALTVREDGRLEVIRRSDNGGGTSRNVSSTILSFPVWLRMQRSGTSYSLSSSSEGSSWDLFATYNVPNIGAAPLVGFANGAYSSTDSSTSELSNILVSYEQDGFSYHEWLYVNALPQSTDPSGDSDGDSVPDGLEYYFNRDPLTPEGNENLPQVEGSGSSVTLRYSRLKTEGANGVIQVSSDLVGWRQAIEGHDYSVSSVTTSPQDVNQEDIVLDMLNPEDDSKVFLRIELE